jgi:hypothetical protein
MVAVSSAECIGCKNEFNVSQETTETLRIEEIKQSTL